MKTVLAHLTLVTLTFDLVNPKSKGFLCYPGWIEVHKGMIIQVRKISREIIICVGQRISFVI